MVELPWYGARKLYRGTAGTRVAKAAFVCVNGLCPCAGDELGPAGIPCGPGSRVAGTAQPGEAADNRVSLGAQLASPGTGESTATRYVFF